MNKSNCNNSLENEIQVQISEVTLTPLTCSTIINEIIKCLLYQKSQIPYPYSWLKSVVNKKRTGEKSVERKPSNLLAERHFNIASTAFDSLENLMCSINSEFKENGSIINRVLLIFGSTIHTAKEIYTIGISGLAFGHLEENHHHLNSKNQHKVIRSIVFSEEWVNAMSSAIPPTNMYVLIEKCDLKTEQQKTDLDFKLSKQYSMCSSIKNLYINLSCNETMKYNCCNDLSIFEDLNNKSSGLNSSVSECSNGNDQDLIKKTLWFESKTFVKGFTKCFINGVSATDIW